MKELHIWEVSATLQGDNIILHIPTSFRVITEKKLFHEAERVAFKTLDNLIKNNEQFTNRTYNGLSTLKYEGTASTLLGV